MNSSHNCLLVQWCCHCYLTLKDPVLLAFGSCNDTTNANHYCQTLHTLHIKIKNKYLVKLIDSILLHDTACLHVV